MLPQALEVMKTWGFEYKSHGIWAKDRVGTGYWFRNQHELLFVGTRGHVPAPAMGTQWPSLIEASVRRHSEKPTAFREMIEAYFPTLPKIELHARGIAPRTGWDVWGLEAPAQTETGRALRLDRRVRARKLSGSTTVRDGRRRTSSEIVP
jgi:N6-adenosine-specific RNA methylase IME4